MSASSDRPRPVRSPIERAYVSVLGPLRRLADAMPSSINLHVVATLPDGDPPVPEGLPPELAELLAAKVLPALRRLDALIALDRAPGDGVWETLEIDVHGHSGHAWIGVRNMLGAREQIACWGVAKGFGAYVAGWSACRSETRDLGTSWDLARRERRVVEYGGPSIVDAGVIRLVDILAGLGFETYSSCEGHPWGAHIGFRPRADQRLARTFADAGWGIDPCGGVARMRTVTTVADRNASWRSTVAAFERAYGLDGLEEAPATAPRAA